MEQCPPPKKKPHLVSIQAADRNSRLCLATTSLFSLFFPSIIAFEDYFLCLSSKTAFLQEVDGRIIRLYKSVLITVNDVPGDFGTLAAD